MLLPPRRAEATSDRCKGAGRLPFFAVSSGPGGAFMNWIFLGAMGGALSVALGAFGAHGLASRLDARGLELWETAARYLMYGSIALVLVGLYGQPGARR